MLSEQFFFPHELFVELSHEDVVTGLGGVRAEVLPGCSRACQVPGAVVTGAGQSHWDGGARRHDAVANGDG